MAHLTVAQWGHNQIDKRDYSPVDTLKDSLEAGITTNKPDQSLKTKQWCIFQPLSGSPSGPTNGYYFSPKVLEFDKASAPPGNQTAERL